MEAKIKVIIKRPDEAYGHMTWISPALHNLQKHVDGPIEMVSVGGSTACICNEEGKLRKLEHNFWIGESFFAEPICGTVIIAGVDGEGLTDIPINMDVWKRLLRGWGN